MEIKFRIVSFFVDKNLRGGILKLLWIKSY